jgi:hypothetical protein
VEIRCLPRLLTFITMMLNRIRARMHEMLPASL